MIESGKYRARAAEWDLGLTSKGSEQVAVLFELLDHPGEQITWYGYFTDKSIKFTVKALRTCGWVGADLSELGDLSINEVMIVVEQEMDDKGEMRARVRWVNGMGGLAMKESMDAQSAKAFAARMRGAILALDPGAAKQHAAAKPAARQTQSVPPDYGMPPPMTDDDLPF